MQKMRRSDREVTGIEEKLAIIEKCKVCRLAMCDGERPYVIPLNFGYEYADGFLTLYFHGAQEGRKINILKKNSAVCFEMDGEHELTVADKDSEYGFNFASIIGFGRLEFIEDRNDKIRGLRSLMKHQTGEDREFFFEDVRVDATMVCKVRTGEFTGKRRMAPQRPPRA
jgi:nitroimidazol reductase NimA-like FMN-containing flavoprotein (pyridoxamine 5'-phosphate oxidase superfamily)